MRRSGLVHRGLDYNPHMRIALCLTFALATAAVPAAASPGHAAAPWAPPAASQAQGVTLEQAVQQAEQRYKARAVKAEERREDGRRVFRIRLLSEDGRVFDVTVDAATGRME
jgi:hypothetical protein